MENFLIINRNKPSAKPEVPEGAILWETCLRYVVFAKTEHLEELKIKDNDELFTGVAAYKYGIELACGIHSKIPGEPEIFGQFKNLIKNNRTSDLSKIFEKINIKVKRVRSKYLTGLGGQSYGSLLRKKLRESKEKRIHIVGGGHFAHELLESLTKLDIETYIHMRNDEKFNELLKKFKGLKRGRGIPVHGTLIIAAPIHSGELTKCFEVDQETRIFDLRGNSVEDPVERFSNVVDLQEFISEVKSNRENLSTKLEAAIQAIDGFCA